jgi:hypothetical protein
MAKIAIIGIVAALTFMGVLIVGTLRGPWTFEVRDRDED